MVNEDSDQYNIQYAYAVDEQNNLVHISQASKKHIYKCCGCKELLSPVQGNKMVHHFRHAESACSHESYLHKTAKLAFSCVFQLNKRINKPLNIELEKVITCKSAKLRASGLRECKSTVTISYDLISLFTIAKVEAYDRETGLTPDILLLNEKTGHKCYIEIFVTHACSNEKLASDVPIIEFQIQNEEDIKSLLDGNYKPSEIISFFNFRPKPASVSECHKSCVLADSMFEKWWLGSNGRFRKKLLNYENVSIAEFSGNKLLPTNVSNEDRFVHLDLLLTNEDAKNEFYNCVKCKHSTSWVEGLVTCTLKGDIHYTKAKECKFYTGNNG